MTKKILITTESLCIGGVENALLSLLKYLKTFDVEIDFYVLKGGEMASEFAKLTKVNFIDVNQPKNKIFNRISKNLFIKRLYKKFKKIQNKKYDIAIAYYGINNYSDMYVAASNAKKKIIWVHNNFEELYKISRFKIALKIRNKIISHKFSYFDDIVAVSTSAKEGFLSIFKKFKNKIRVINNFFDIELLNKKSEKCEKLKGNKIIMYVGRLVSSKAVDKLIYEYSLALKTINDMQLYIIGDGPEKEKLEKLVKKLSIVSNVSFLGYQRNPYKYMKQADLIVTASKSETYSVNIIEALALKKYFISANNAGVNDVFYGANEGNLENGIVCDENSIHKEIINYFDDVKKYSPCFNIDKYNKSIKKSIKSFLKL